MLSHAGILFMRLLSHLPLAWIRALGAGLGLFLFVVARPRRRVALRNLALCFPERSDEERLVLARQTFIHFAQAWLDRSWLWHAPVHVLRKQLRITGAVDALAGSAPTVLFMPHFVGLDAGWMALTQEVAREFTTIYARQTNAVVDAWILAGRQRFGRLRAFGQHDGVKSIVAALRQGDPLCLLPDMDLGARESVFVPFFGVSTATVPSLSRFASLGRAQVVPVVTRMTPEGYDAEVHAAWAGFPTGDAVADTARMNRELEAIIRTMPNQYYWVHKRFKTRPPGETSVY
jgi:Kdo2-lipid IVA lauroyltransferase/acyltransferase